MNRPRAHHPRKLDLSPFLHYTLDNSIFPIQLEEPSNDNDHSVYIFAGDGWTGTDGLVLSFLYFMCIWSMALNFICSYLRFVKKRSCIFMI